MANNSAAGRSQAYLRRKPITAKVSEHGENEHVAYGVSTMQGWRAQQEDAYFCILDFDKDVSLFGVFDGHGGSEVAVLAVEKLPSMIKNNGYYEAREYKAALKRAYIDFDEYLLTMDGYRQLKEIRDRNSNKKKKKNDNGTEKISEDLSCGYFSGCTAVVAMLVNNHMLYVANAGDSRCVVAEYGGMVADLTTDHKPEIEPELSRILKAGGTVVSGRINHVLNMSRAFGDHLFKANESLPMREQMVIAKPEVRARDLATGNDDFIVLATDGIWETMPDVGVIDFIRKRIKNGGMKISSACEQLMNKCVSPDIARGGRGLDNMTVIVIKFKHGRNGVRKEAIPIPIGYLSKLKLE